MTSTLNNEIVAIIFIAALTVGGFSIIFGYRKRATPILKLFNSTYFQFEIINPAGISTVVNRTPNDFKIVGKIILFKYKEGMYRVIEECLFLRNKIPGSLYTFGNPNPINVFNNNDPIIKVWSEDSKQFEEMKMSSKELLDAIESKVVHDLNKFTFNRMEMVTIILSIVSIFVSVIVLIEMYQLNGSFTSLINELNQILAHFPTTQQAPGVGGANG